MAIFLIIIAVLGVFVASMYNTLVRKKNMVANVFATVDTMLKKRYNLIPNLVATVQEYMQHERHLLTEVTRLRAKALSGDATDEEKIDIDRRISKLIRGILVAVEMFPTNIIANLFNYRRKRLFEISPVERRVADVHALFQR